MIIRTKRVKDPFARILNETLCDKRLSYRARGILAYLLSKPHDWQVVSEDIVNNGTEGRDSIRSCFKELKKFGYAKLVTNPAGGSMWIICEDNGTERLKNGISGEPEKADALKIRHYKDGEEGTKKETPNPKGALVRKKLKVGKPTDPDAIRVAACVGRQASTEWGESEIKLFKAQKKRADFDEELALIERYYAANRKKSDNICRTNVERLLKFWAGEVDRARDWCEKHPLKSARKIVHRKDGPILEAALAARPPEMDPQETKAFCNKFERQFGRLPAGYRRDGESILFVGSANGAHAK